MADGVGGAGCAEGLVAGERVSRDAVSGLVGGRGGGQGEDCGGARGFGWGVRVLM